MENKTLMYGLREEIKDTSDKQMFFKGLQEAIDRINMMLEGEDVTQFKYTLTAEYLTDEQLEELSNANEE